MDHCTCKQGGIAINRLFDSETPIWALFGRMADLAILSLLWTICCIPVITAGASTAALMRAVMNMNTGAGNWRARHFFRYFRSNFRSATLLWLIFLPVAVLLIADLLILAGTVSLIYRMQRIAAVIGLIIWVFTAIWAFTLTAVFDTGIIQTIKNAFYLGISWLPRTIAMSVLWMIPVGLLAFYPDIFSRIIVLWPVLLSGGTAYVCSKLMFKPLKPYFEQAGMVFPEDTAE